MYQEIGCYADTKHQAGRIELEAKHSLLMDHHRRRTDAVDKCGIAADSFGYNVFAIREKGQCASSMDYHLRFDEDGKCVKCQCVGEYGGNFAIRVYEIKSEYFLCLDNFVFL